MKFADAKVVPYISLEGESHQPSSSKRQTDADRLAAAKSRSMELVKRSNPVGGESGFEYGENYFKDFCGPESSKFVASNLVFLARMIEMKLNGKTILLGIDDFYQARTGLFQEDQQIFFSLQELKDAYSARIAELGLSEVLLWEWIGTVRSMSASNAFFDLPFEQRLQKFRQ